MDIFTPITNAECVLPPKTGGRKMRAKHQSKRQVKRIYKGGKAKVHSKYHSIKRTRKGMRKSRVTRRRK